MGRHLPVQPLPDFAAAVWWMKLGIVPERIEAGHPEQNGRHERMHRTLKQEVSTAASGQLAGAATMAGAVSSGV